MLLNHDFPINFHEYDVVIVDLSFIEKTSYNKEENTRSKNKSGNNTYLLCEYPQTLFDPRAFASHLLIAQIKEIMKHDSLLIVFQSENETIDYKMVEENGIYPRSVGEENLVFTIFYLYSHFRKIKLGRKLG